MIEFLRILGSLCLTAITVVAAIIACIVVLPFAANLLFNFETFDTKDGNYFHNLTYCILSLFFCPNLC